MLIPHAWTTIGPTLSPVASLCFLWLPSHLGNLSLSQQRQKAALSGTSAFFTAVTIGSFSVGFCFLLILPLCPTTGVLDKSLAALFPLRTVVAPTALIKAFVPIWKSAIFSTLLVTEFVWKLAADYLLRWNEDNRWRRFWLCVDEVKRTERASRGVSVI